MLFTEVMVSALEDLQLPYCPLTVLYNCEKKICRIYVGCENSLVYQDNVCECVCSWVQV